MGARIGGATRAQWLPRWPGVGFASAAILALFRGAPSIALGLALLSVLAWLFWPGLAGRRPPSSAASAQTDPEDARARSLLGVSATATAAEIRAAYRERMRRAHPD